MAKEYIERESVLKNICNACDGWCNNTNCDCVNCKSDHRCDIIIEIADTPAADVVEVVHSHWVHDYSNVFKCFTCLGKECMAPYNLRPYCPNCGARMDGE